MSREDRLQAKLARANAKALRPWYRKKRWWLLGIIVLGGGAIVATTSSDEAEKTVRDATNRAKEITGRVTEADDVIPGTCEVQGLNTVQMKIVVVNNSSKRSNYSIEGVVERVSDGTRLESLRGDLQNLDPGQRAEDTLFGFSVPEGTTTAAISCRIVSVDRTSAV